MAKNAFTVHARAGLQGEHIVDCDISNIAVLWETEHQSSKEVVTIIKTLDGARLQSKEPFDTIYNTIQKSGEIFVDAVSTDGQNDTRYLLNVRATEPVPDQEELFVTTTALPGTVFIPLDEEGFPYTEENFPSPIPPTAGSLESFEKPF